MNVEKISEPNDELRKRGEKVNKWVQDMLNKCPLPFSHSELEGAQITLVFKDDIILVASLVKVVMPDSPVDKHRLN